MFLKTTVARPCKVSIAQIPCIQFIKILYQIALKHEYYELPCDANIATQISGLVLKKTSDVSRSTRSVKTYTHSAFDAFLR